MGADLIGYMVFGPIKVKKTEAELKAYFEANKKETEVTDGGSDATVLGLAPSPEWVEGHDEPETDDVLDLDDFIQESNDFMDFWNEENSRDCSFRVNPNDPEGKVGFAGDTTWGDSPEGVGYQAFDFVQKYELWDLFGLK